MLLDWDQAEWWDSVEERERERWRWTRLEAHSERATPAEE